MGWLGSVLGWPSNTILVGVRPEVAAALFGVVVGVLTERIARALGRLRCEASGWETKFTSALTKFGEFREIEPGQAEMLARRVEYRFAIDLYNGKEVPAGLRDIYGGVSPRGRRVPNQSALRPVKRRT